MKTFNHNQYIPFDKLDQLPGAHAEPYKTATPFPHAVFDDVFDPEVLDQIIDEFDKGEKTWKEFNTRYENKKQMNSDLSLEPVTRAFIHNLNSEPFLRFLEKLTGIQGLIPDPYLIGGGLHKIPKGGKLGIHVDFNQHPIMNVFRRLNVLVYLNKDWNESWGGDFELWDAKKTACAKKLSPVFNRMAIFSTTSTSFHGHPEPLDCPEDRSRISLALYYYTAVDHGEQALKPHSTQFLTATGKRIELTGKTSLPQRVTRKLKKIFKVN